MDRPLLRDALRIQASVLRVFLTPDGRIAAMPRKAIKRLALLDHVARSFPVGERWSELEVNARLREFGDDYVTLRRYLVDEGFLDRADGFHWRIGGTVELDEVAPAVVVDPDVYAVPDREYEYVACETCVVTGPSDTAAVCDALTAAARRMFRVDEDGVEYRSNAEADTAYFNGRCTPAYVADPVVTPAGVELYVDCKGHIPPPMGQTFRRILAEELEFAGLQAHVRSR